MFQKINIGIMGTGSIACIMAETLGKMRNVKCYAVASRTQEKAEAFARGYGFKKAYGSYEEMAQDKKVDLVYIATPHSEHYQNAMLCLQNKKPVLCEKAFTVNEEQGRKLFDYAKENNVFIAEAIWPRYMPMVKKMKEVLDSNVIGEPVMLTANLGYPVRNVPRLYRPELAGGTLLDLGVYPLNFAAMFFGTDIEKIQSVCTYTDTGVDEQESITLIYKDGRTAVLSATMLAVTDRQGVIYGTEGYIIVENINNFESFSTYGKDHVKLNTYKRPKQISGYEYEVEACIRALKEGWIQCPEMPHEESLKILHIMDGLRKDWKIVYPLEREEIQKTEAVKTEEITEINAVENE